MHALIGILVYANGSEDALDAAYEVVREKIEYWHSRGAFESLRGPISLPLQVSTARFPTDDKSGLEMVNFSMEINRDEFKESMVRIRYLISKYTGDQLFDEEVKGKDQIEIEGIEFDDDTFGFRDYCGDASGQIQGPGVYLYDFRGHCVTRLKVLQRMLNDSDSNPWYIDLSEGQNPNWGPHIWNRPLWVVPFDAHY